MRSSAGAPSVDARADPDRSRSPPIDTSADKPSRLAREALPVRRSEPATDSSPDKPTNDPGAPAPASSDATVRSATAPRGPAARGCRAR